MKSVDSPKIRILVVDDHLLFRRGLIALLTHDPLLYVIDDAENAVLALPKALALQPDVILLDNHMPAVSGVEALPSLHAAAPKACILMANTSGARTADEAVRIARLAKAGGHGPNTNQSEQSGDWGRPSRHQ